MTDRIKRDIIDNSTDDITMQKVLNSEIPHAKQLDISTGYFDVAGYGLLRQTLEPAAKNGSFAVRLLLGKGAMPPPEEAFEEIVRSTGDEPLSIKAHLDGEDLEPNPREDAASLIELLERSNVQVRLGPSRFNHSKCYILGDNSVFVGSSNLTAGGLVGNYELNAGLYQPGVTTETRRWFDRMWEQASDAKEDLLRILRQSKFGAPADPHDVYMKMLFEKFKPFLQRPERTGKDAKLTAFQQDAVDTSMHLISSYGGAIIADSTGLGKTNMGIEIMRQKIHNEGKKAMLVAPAQVLQSMWNAKLKDASIVVRQTASMESVGRESFLDELHKYRNIDFVVIDESQNFRSKNAQRRLNLMKMLAVGKDKQILLLTATPINNSLMDLYYQLSIITKGRDDHFLEAVGIVDLYKHMRDATNKDLQQGLEKIEQLLDGVMVRRTRSFIQDVYHDDKIGGEPITFPKPEYQPIKYDLAGLFGNVFERLFDDIQSLTMAPYGLEHYNKSLSEEDRNSHKARAHLQVVLLLKRFESSVEAVRKSLGRKIRMYEHVERTLRQGKMLRVAQFNKVLAKCTNREVAGDFDDEDPEDELVRMCQEVAVEDLGDNYETARMLSDIGSDLGTLRGLQAELEKITVDKKFEAVRDAIIADRALEQEGCKVLVFTEYTDTAKHLHEKMREAFPDKEILLIYGNTKPETRQKYIRRFSPKANLGEDEILNEKEADILVSTEVLSEGQNLQDCNYVVNYDLPWNPMRIVQRTGRVDRLTSNHKFVHSRACYPDEQLDGLLKLVGKLLDKISTVAAVVGTDSEILGEMPSPKEFNGRLATDIRALAGQGDWNPVIQKLQSASDMMPQSTPINEIMRHVKKIGFEAMGAVPMGRRSGKRGEGQKAVLAYLQEGRTRRVHFVIYDYATDRAEVSDNDRDAIGLVACTEGTPLHLPMDGEDHRESFEQLLAIDCKAREAIRHTDREGKKKAAELRTRQKPAFDSKILLDAMNAGELTEEDANAVLNIIKSEQMHNWQSAVRDICEQHKDDAASMCKAILHLADQLYMKDREPGAKTPAERDAKLKLVGAMFIMDSFDPGFGKKGLKKHI